MNFGWCCSLSEPLNFYHVIAGHWFLRGLETKPAWNRLLLRKHQDTVKSPIRCCILQYSPSSKMSVARDLREQCFICNLEGQKRKLHNNAWLDRPLTCCLNHLATTSWSKLQNRVLQNMDLSLHQQCIWRLQKAHQSAYFYSIKHGAWETGVECSAP